MEMVYYPYPKAPFLTPDQVVGELDLKSGEKVLDFGAGAGYWAIPMAQAVGTAGHVYVTDAKAENLSIIKTKAQNMNLDNLSYFVAPYHGKEMPIQTKVDLILCSNIFSMIKDPADVLKQAKKLSKDGTRLVVIDWNDKTPIGPQKEDRMNTENIIAMAGKLGFEFKKLLSAGDHHTGLYFIYSNKTKYMTKDILNEENEPQEGIPVCEKCGNVKIKEPFDPAQGVSSAKSEDTENNEWVCPHCQGEINFLGEEDE
jgi:ubiquinone/menaquinone biosynthesis C-methylase UbiE/rubredoxin